MSEIKFGTSGWRGIISDDFTFANVCLVSQAISNYILEKEKNKSVIIGYDTRFLSEKFAVSAAEVLAANQIKVFFCKDFTPTPVISFEILHKNLGGGINITASHNPFNYNGIKFSPSWGGPALPETTQFIEKECFALLNKDKEIKKINFAQGLEKNLIEYIDPSYFYKKRIKEIINFEIIKKRSLKIVVDILFGTAKGYLDDLLKEAGINLEVIHNYRDVLFGGQRPEPSGECLSTAREIMQKKNMDLILATDGDADRFGIVDKDGTYISPNYILALLLDHLVKTRKWTGVVARSVMTSSLVDKVASLYNIKVIETPVGFKYIGDILVHNDLIIGGEESGGLTIKGHVPEKDGILACLLVAEMVAIQGKSVKEILNELYLKTGYLVNERINLEVEINKIKDYKDKLSKSSPNKIAGMRVKEVNKLDGYKFILEDNCWLGVRFSGTEPVIRFYLEASSEEKLKQLKESVNRYEIFG